MTEQVLRGSDAPGKEEPPTLLQLFEIFRVEERYGQLCWEILTDMVAQVCPALYEEDIYHDDVKMDPMWFVIMLDEAEGYALGGGWDEYQEDWTGPSVFGIRQPAEAGQ